MASAGCLRLSEDKLVRSRRCLLVGAFQQVRVNVAGYLNGRVTPLLLEDLLEVLALLDLQTAECMTEVVKAELPYFCVLAGWKLKIEALTTFTDTAHSRRQAPWWLATRPRSGERSLLWND